ncbi:MAG: cellulase family glycosylhydrolase, partial [Anaerolineae bacterium]|nr:cellulase family glycosylhydrolase [Anaerolineae bacterium]
MTPDTTKQIRLDGAHFKDEHGRTLLLRGVNLAGSSKVPTIPNGATHLKEGFFDHRNVSFVGRPFPLADADEHFERLRTWGLTCLRFLVTWEAIEHAGPGQYDTAYLDYLEAVVEKAAEYDMLLFIDPHQDVWSRFTGGDGAPGWTLELAGFDIRNFHETGAALVHQLHGDPFPRMQWAGNYTKLATATMFTLFFGGRDFAPKLTIEGENIQDYLQRHFLASMQQVVKRMVGKDHVIGYDSFNEPSQGFIGKHNLRRTETPLLLGPTPSPYQAMLLGEGIAQSVTDWQLNTNGLRALGRKFIDPEGKRAWLPGRQGIWQEHFVWG